MSLSDDFLWVDFVAKRPRVYGWLEAITVPYQPGFASWGTSSGVINSL